MQKNLNKTEMPPNLTLLHRLVITLLLVMIAGFIILITLLVISLSSLTTPKITQITLPNTITLPNRQKPLAITQAQDWWALISHDNIIFIYNRSDGKLRQTIKIKP